MIDVQRDAPNIAKLAVQVNKFVNILDDKLRDDTYHFGLTEFTKLIKLMNLTYLESKHHANGDTAKINLDDMTADRFMTNERYDVKIGFDTYPKKSLLTYPSSTLVNLLAITKGPFLIIDDLGDPFLNADLGHDLTFQFKLAASGNVIGLEAYEMTINKKITASFNEIKKMF